uniref:Uncharacterized protein n=1 Tax=Spermophilus dauricus TaxID=99837 RepID=A0A8C9Q5Z8_SPEDA
MARSEMVDVTRLQNCMQLLVVSTHPDPALSGLYGVRSSLTLGFSLFTLSKETEEKDIKCSRVSVSAQVFPGSMIVVSYLHVYNIFNGEVFLFISLQKCNVFGVCYFPGVIYHFDRTLQSAEMLCLGMLQDCMIWVAFYFVNVYMYLAFP